jgi:iron complex transport system ATP-binding protein
MVEKTSTPSLGSTPPFLQMQEVAFGYNQQALLYDVSVAVRAGEMVALLGPNGSGKTTLLRLLSGVLQPKQGNILLEGRDLRSWGRRQIAQRIAVVPQELHMPFSFTVEHMVGLGRTPFGVHIHFKIKKLYMMLCRLREWHLSRRVYLMS